MDSTIVTGETLDELADFAGLKPRIAEITARAMNGDIAFESEAGKGSVVSVTLPSGG